MHKSGNLQAFLWHFPIDFVHDLTAWRRFTTAGMWPSHGKSCTEPVPMPMFRRTIRGDAQLRSNRAIHCAAFECSGAFSNPHEFTIFHVC